MVCILVLSASVFSSILSLLRLIQEPSFYLNQVSSLSCLPLAQMNVLFDFVLFILLCRGCCIYYTMTLCIFRVQVVCFIGGFLQEDVVVNNPSLDSCMDSVLVLEVPSRATFCFV